MFGIIILMAGAGREKSRLADVIKTNDLEDYVRLLGYISKEEVLSLRKASYINLSLMGGFSLIESCVSGRPVIAYDVEWHYELIKNAETGYLLKEGDVAEIVKKAGYLADNPETAEKIGKNAKELVFAWHSLDKTVKIKIGCYEKLLAKN